MLLRAVFQYVASYALFTQAMSQSLILPEPALQVYALYWRSRFKNNMSTVVVQVNFSGNPLNIFPKISAVISAALLPIGGALGYYFSHDTEKKYLTLSLVGILVSIIT